MKSNFVVPPLYRDAQRTLQLTELAVQGFARYHKYAVGADLRRQTMTVMQLMHRALLNKNLQRIEALMWAIEDLKLTLQLAKEVKAFNSFKQFEELAVLAAKMSKQCGGWQRSMRTHQAIPPVVGDEETGGLFPHHGQKSSSPQARR